MALYRGVAERVVEIYDFNWQGNDRMKEACVCIWSVKLLCPGSVLWTGMLMLLGMLISGVTNYKYGAKQTSIGNRRQSYRKKMFGIYGIICLMMLVIFVIYAETGAEMCRQVVLI